MKKIINPSNAQKNFYQLLEEININHMEIHIISDRDEKNAMLISLGDWKSLKETLVLEQTGVLGEVRRRKKDESGYTKIDEKHLESL